jgi:phosphoglycerate dehydrogenase-like enzyme
VINPRKIAIEPKSFSAYEQAVRDSGGEPCQISSDVAALVWTDYSQPLALEQMLSENPQLQWVQLPFAGVDTFSQVLDHPVRFTSAKGSYSEPVAEHALMLCLALGRAIPERIRAKSWGKKFAKSLYDSNVLIVGAGGITAELISLLTPFRADITVVRNLDQAMEGANRTLPLESLASALAKADFVILACALTPRTKHLFDLAMLKNMKADAYLVNIARGAVVVSEDLLTALESGVIAGAGIDVTDPEPLPDGHALWNAPNLIITPHTADTNEMVVRMFSERLRLNTKAFLQQGDWVGIVSPDLGY